MTIQNSKFKIQNSSTGFTLIEILIYTVLTSLIIGGFLVVVYQIIESNSNLTNKIIVEQEADFLFHKIKWVLIGISSINNPLLGISGSILSVNKINSLENPFIFDLDSGSVRLKRGSSSPATLNSQNVIISNLSFDYLPAGLGALEAIKVSLTVNGKNFTDTIYLRK
ncbi:prepilin-type N-terminal cleavage/methylation domain-containing protein [Candidatus Azambacteria bacterium]|nr:prepilin-type N-terminal cleavage/methylation domain-containing protein [Candidatus Azambacteria bacterium]